VFLYDERKILLFSFSLFKIRTNRNLDKTKHMEEPEARDYQFNKKLLLGMERLN
jgi:hypothetical protein